MRIRRHVGPINRMANRKKEVQLAPCPDCKGTGHIKSKDDSSMCFRCGGSGEIVKQSRIIG